MRNRYQVTLDTASNILNRIDDFTEGFIKHNNVSLLTAAQRDRARHLIKTHINISLSFTDGVRQELLILSEDHGVNMCTLIKNSIIKEFYLILQGDTQAIDTADRLGDTLLKRLLEVISDIQELADSFISSVEEEEE